MKLQLTGILMIITSSIYAQKWKEGYYFDNQGVKHVGLIDHLFSAHWDDGPDNSIHYKSTKKSKKTHLTTNEVSSFVIESDSFSIVKDFSLNSMGNYEEDFAKVLVTGELILYKHYTTGGTGTTKMNFTSYLVQKNEKLIVIRNYLQLRDRLPELISDAPDLISKIKNKIYNKKDLPIIVKEYNSLH